MNKHADYESITRRNSVVYRCLSPSPAEALLFGNGVTGGSVCTPDDSLRIQVGRGDIWNESGGMGAIAAVRIRGCAGLFAGALAVRQECNLFEAVITIRVETPSGEVCFRIECLRGHDLVVVGVEDSRAEKSGFDVTLENWHDSDPIRKCGLDEIETWHANTASCFREWNARVRVDAAELSIEEPLLGRAWAMAVRSRGADEVAEDRLRLSAAASHQIFIATSCVAPKDGEDCVGRARGICRELVATSAKQIDEWLVAHARYWREFWSKSHLSMRSETGDAEYEERLWYVTLYTIAIGSGGEYPIRCFGGNFLLDGDARDWDGGYWFQNMREVYWPLLASGHWEFFQEFFRMYFRSADFVRAQTRAIFQIDALSYRETQTFWGLDVGTDLPAGRIAPVTHHYFSSNLECCLLMDWYCRASGDETFLRDEFYPFLKGVLEFYLRYAPRGEDGTYHLTPVSSLETWLDVCDDLPNLCGLHYFLPRVIAWGERFGAGEEDLARWREFLKNLAPIPVGRWTVSSRYVMGIPSEGIHTEDFALDSELDPRGIFLPAAGIPKGKTLRRNMENAELYVIFPWGLVGRDSAPEEVRRAENTWNNRTWRYPNNSWAQDTVQLARMGWADRAAESLSQHGSYSQRFPNGCFIGPGLPHFHGLLTNVPYLDGAGVHATALNEMLLQSYDGIIRIAPSVPRGWSGSFKLHALGGFVVEGRFSHGAPRSATITATRDEQLQISNSGPCAMQVDGENVEIGRVLEKTMRAGESVHCHWEHAEGEAEESALEDARPEVVWPAYKVRPAHVARPTGHWHDERSGHGQIGLAEDGLYPAIR